MFFVYGRVSNPQKVQKPPGFLQANDIWFVCDSTSCERFYLHVFYVPATLLYNYRYCTPETQCMVYLLILTFAFF